MDVTPMMPEGRKVIDSYGPGRFQVAGEPMAGSILVLPEAVLPWPGVAGPGDLTLEAFDPLIARAEEIEVLLLGCGDRMAPLPSALKRALRDRGLICDPMDTGAACRTYNVLLAEERRVCAALIALA